MLLAATVALTVLVSVLAYQSWWRFNHGLDLNIYLEATRAFWNGASPYAIAAPAPFVYPPFVCLVLWPLALLPFEAAAVIWFVISLVALATSLWMILSISGRVDVATATVACAAVCVLCTEILQNNLRNAQINFLVLACVLSFAFAWSRRRRGVAVCWLAVAIATKITPAIFLFWLARRREWRAASAAALLAVAFVVALPALVTGPRIVSDLDGYVRTFIGGVAPGYGTTSERRPFSVAGALHRFTTISWSFDALVLGAIVVLITVLLFDRGASRGESTAASISLYLVAALLATPLSEVHHLAALLPGAVWLTYQALSGELSRPRVGALAFVFISLLLRRSFHAAAFAAVASAWLLLAAECYSASRSSQSHGD